MSAEVAMMIEKEVPPWRQPRGKSMFFSQLPYKCHQNRVASVGDLLKICPQLDSRVEVNPCEAHLRGGLAFTSL